MSANLTRGRKAPEPTVSQRAWRSLQRLGIYAYLVRVRPLDSDLPVGESGPAELDYRELTEAELRAATADADVDLTFEFVDACIPG